MSDSLQHDPRTKQVIKETLFEYLYTPVIKSFQARILDIANRNTALGNYSHCSFIYRDEIYNFEPSNPLPRRMNRLLPQLQPEMNAYLREVKELNEEEMVYVLGYINKVLNTSNDFHDYLRLLPEAVHQPIQGLINTCPCRTKKLSEESVQEFTEQNQKLMSLIGQRMVSNLLI
jgi:hypothetical protein